MLGAGGLFYLPDAIVMLIGSSRKQSIFLTLPDALDLMVVCVESGLTLDASIQRVGSEIALAHPDISKEFGITHMETRVGLSRVDALPAQKCPGVLNVVNSHRLDIDGLKTRFGKLCHILRILKCAPAIQPTYEPR